ncbi:MAG: hypothetical protein U5R46_03765 [Gammaproteobacteria bacterium]|nr:hypothetical protein [Gammaproteobacteria bacterium]
MTDDYRFSDELLNAYVDGELVDEERRFIDEAMRSDDRLRERVQELQGLKSLVRDAYQDEIPMREVVAGRRLWNTAALAASVAAFAVGVAVTWGVYTYTDSAGGPRVASLSSQDEGNSGDVQGAVKVVFHVSRDDPEKLIDILNEAEALLTTTTRAGTTASVRIIASGEGLSLFENRPTSATERVTEMKAAYEGDLIFSGCGVAYDQLKEQRPDGKLELLPAIKLVDLGVLELMRRQREGWAYIRL